MKRSAFFAVFVCLVIPQAVIADVITFNDREAWRAAANGSPGDLAEDFNTFQGITFYGKANGEGLQAGFLSFSKFDANNAGNDSTWSISSPSHGLWLDAFALLGNTPAVTLYDNDFFGDRGDTVISHAPIRAIGFDYVSQSSPQNTASPFGLITSRGDIISGPTTGLLTTGFFGFVYTNGETFTSSRVADLSDGRMFLLADNFEAFSGVSSVPEPSGLVLFSAVTLISFFKRKRHHQLPVQKKAKGDTQSLALTEFASSPYGDSTSLD